MLESGWHETKKILDIGPYKTEQGIIGNLADAPGKVATNAAERLVEGSFNTISKISSLTFGKIFGLLGGIGKLV